MITLPGRSFIDTRLPFLLEKEATTKICKCLDLESRADLPGGLSIVLRRSHA